MLQSVNQTHKQSLIELLHGVLWGRALASRGPLLLSDTTCIRTQGSLAFLNHSANKK